LSRERDSAASKYKFKEIADEAKHQEEVKTLRRKMKEEKDLIIWTLRQEFEEMDGLSGDDCESGDIEEEIRRIAQKYRLEKKNMC
jgi:hypothetical protein